MVAIPRVQAGFRLFDGTLLNGLINTLNNLTGNGTAGPVAATTIEGASLALSGNAVVNGLLAIGQGAPAAKTTSGLLTAANVLAGIITVTQGAGAPSAQQMPTGTDLQAGLPANFAIGDAFDFSVINLGGASEVASITVNTDVTIVGNAAIPIPATGVQSSGRFRARKTADHVFVIYRIA